MLPAHPALLAFLPPFPHHAVPLGRLPVALAQVTGVALDRISQGGTQGLIYALAGAAVALALAVSWLLREHLRASAKHAEAMQGVQTRHADNVQAVQTAHAKEILAIQQASAGTLAALTERVTESMGAMNATARDLRDAISAAQEMTRTLELTLDRSAVYGRDDTAHNGTRDNPRDAGRDPLRGDSQHGRNAARPTATPRRRGQDT